jgi:hypothetical protein
MPHPMYVRFPVIETIELSEKASIRQAVDKVIKEYVLKDPLGTFSYRILLPRDQKSNKKAKMIGLAFQGELLLGLRKHKIVPNLREVRYIHDENHYGWLIANPQVYERFESGIV